MSTEIYSYLLKKHISAMLLCKTKRQYLLTL